METYHKLIRFLKKNFPADLPVRVRRRKLSKALDGYCKLKDDYYLIVICKEAPEHEAVDTLLHEWAHTLTWDKCPKDDHCNEWGIAYSRIYRMFVNDFLPPES